MQSQHAHLAGPELSPVADALLRIDREEAIAPSTTLKARSFALVKRHPRKTMAAASTARSGKNRSPSLPSKALLNPPRGSGRT